MTLSSDNFGRNIPDLASISIPNLKKMVVQSPLARNIPNRIYIWLGGACTTFGTATQHTAPRMHENWQAIKGREDRRSS